MSRQHALLSASSAHRWINCPPSAKLQEQYEDKGSAYAEQGTDEEVEEILGKADQLISWVEDIKEYALQSAIGGKHWQGYKLVEGRSNRCFTDEQAVARAVTEDGKDPYEKKLLGITAMTSLLGRKRFNELLGKYVEKPRGKATLVPESDKRPAMDFASFNDANDYHDENEEGD